jgi:hypothetical protein
MKAAIAGDEPAFAALTERHRPELHVHCYRMLASFDEAQAAACGADRPRRARLVSPRDRLGARHQRRGG